MLAEFQGWADVVLVPAGEGIWAVLSEGTRVGTWRRTEHGATLQDTSGEHVAVASAFAGTTQVVIAGCGAHADAWSGLARMVLSGRCEMRAAALLNGAL